MLAGKFRGFCLVGRSGSVGGGIRRPLKPPAIVVQPTSGVLPACIEAHIQWELPLCTSSHLPHLLAHIKYAKANTSETRTGASDSLPLVNLFTSPCSDA